MNTKYNFDRRFALTISVLLTTLWLPITTFAQDFTETGDFTPGANTRVDNCARCQNISDSHDLRDCQQLPDTLTILADSDSRVREESVGFAETDPTDHHSFDVVALLHATNNQVQQVYEGFAETDPAGQQSPDTVTVLQASNNLAQQVVAGFDETDPAINIYQSVGETYHQALVDCLGGNAKGMVLRHRDFSTRLKEDFNGGS